MLNRSLRLSCVCALLGLLLLPSCRKGLENVQDSGLRASLTVRYDSSLSSTRASDLSAAPGEEKVNSLDVLVFRADGSGLLDVYHHATASELESGSVSLLSPIGTKDIYLLANAPESLGLSGITEDKLRSSLVRLSDNDRDSFMMIGTPGHSVTLKEGENDGIRIPLRRYCARVAVKSIRAAFTSPAYRDKHFHLKRIYLANVNPTAPVLEGNIHDPFAENNSGVTIMKNSRYYWPFPARELGFVNPLHSMKSITGNPSEASLTIKEFSGLEAALYPLSPTAGVDGTWDEGAYLYALPNQSKVNMTNLVLETVLEGHEYYYVFSIPDVQPNTCYTFSEIVLTLPGNTDTEPIESVQARIRLEISNWSDAVIEGEYNDPNVVRIN